MAWLKPTSSRKLAALALIGFLVGVTVVPALVWFWPSPSFYGQLFDFRDARLQVAVRFESDGPIASGNSIYVDSVTFFGYCPLWNISAFSVWVEGYNASADGVVHLGPYNVDFIACEQIVQQWNLPITFRDHGEGSITFYSSGTMPLIMGGLHKNSLDS